MSDKTPAGAGDEHVEPVESDVANSDVDGGEPAVDADRSRPVIKRRTAPAPVRRRSPEEDDEEIAHLEKDFSEEEHSSAAAIRRRTVKAPSRKRSVAARSAEIESDKEHNPYSTRSPKVFVKQSVAELKKVVWPTRKEMSAYFVAVLVFVLFIIAFVLILDLVYGWALLGLLGD